MIAFKECGGWGPLEGIFGRECWPLFFWLLCLLKKNLKAVELNGTEFSANGN
jgi:hypothetical protein